MSHYSSPTEESPKVVNRSEEDVMSFLQRIGKMLKADHAAGQKVANEIDAYVTKLGNVPKT